MSDTISFEMVKVFFWEEADKAKNRDDLLERVIQRAYQQGKEDAVKDGDAGLYPEALNGNAHIMQPCPNDGAEEVYDEYYDTAGNYHWIGTKSGEHRIPAYKDGA